MTLTALRPPSKLHPEGCFSLPATRDPFLFLRRSVSLVDREAIGPIRSRKGHGGIPETIRGEAKDVQSSSVSKRKTRRIGPGQQATLTNIEHSVTEGSGPAKTPATWCRECRDNRIRPPIIHPKGTPVPLTERRDRSAIRPEPAPTHAATSARQALCTRVSQVRRYAV